MSLIMYPDNMELFRHIGETLNDPIVVDHDPGHYQIL